MSDRWTRAGERSRQRADDLQRRYRRGGAHRSATEDWEDEDDTAVIPRYVDDQPDPRYIGDDYDPDYGAADYDPRYQDPRYQDPGYRDGYAEPEYAEPEYAEAEYVEATAEFAAPPARPSRRSGHRYLESEDDLDELADEPIEDDEPMAPPPARRGTRPASSRAASADTVRRAQRSTSRKAPQRSSRNSAEKPARSGGGRKRSSRAASRKAAERRKRRRNMVVLGCVFIVLIVVAGGYAGYKFIGSLGGPEEFDGPAGPLAVVQVHPGDTAGEIAQSMFDKGVVASTGAFFQAAMRNSGITSVQPGYYAVPSHSKGEDAVTALLGKESRVGAVVVSGGRRLHDSTDVHTGARNEGIYRKIADASCVGTGTDKKCVTYEQLDAAGSAADPAVLGVPAWALDAVRKVPDRTRQLEGLIGAGSWNFDPSGTPEQILAQLVSESAASYETTGLLQSGATNKLDPYQSLVAASLVEREALPEDMPKVARVVLNRLDVGQPLQLDSTVNYTLDRTEVATTDDDRARETPWNTYAMSGLPATPISSPSLKALRAVEEPAPGPWLYFVTVDMQGTTLFTESYQEHLRNIERAQESGILDSGR